MEQRFGVSAHAATQPDAVALVWRDRRITYRELDEASNRAARVLAARGVSAGSGVAIGLTNRPEFLEFAFGATRLDAEVVPVPPGATHEEIAYYLDESGATLIVVESDARTRAATNGLPALHLDDALSAELAAAASTPLPDAPIDHVRLRSYTSGTTGRPKAVLRPAYPREILAEQSIAYSTRYFGIDGSNERTLVCQPIYHLAGFATLHTPLLAGKTAVLMERFDAAEWLALVERERITFANLAPVHFFRLYALPAEVRAGADLSSLKLVTHGSALCPVDLKWRMMDLFPPDTLWETYGGTETMGTIISPADWREHPGSVGRAAPDCTVRVLDDDGHELPPGEIGLVYLASPHGSQFRYSGPPELTDEIYRDGLATLGDVGSLDEDGYLYVVDRRKDMINTGGQKVYPAEVETVLREHPGVREVAVVGAPDPEYGERVVAVVAAHDGGAPDADALIAFARERLVRYKAPRRVDFVDDLPRNAVGKVDKRALRDPYWAEAGRRI